MSKQIPTTFIAGGTKNLGERNASKIWDSDSTSWYEHDGWEPTNRSHKWSVAQLDYCASLTQFVVTPRGNSVVELNGYTLYGSNHIGELQSGSIDNVDLLLWTELTTIKGITGETKAIGGPYEVLKGRNDVHFGESVVIPIASNSNFKYVMIYAPGANTEQGNGDVLAVEVFGQAEALVTPKETLLLTVREEEPVGTLFIEMNELMHAKVKVCCEQLTNQIKAQQETHQQECMNQLKQIQHKINKGLADFEAVFQTEYTTLHGFILTKRKEHRAHTTTVQEDFEADVQSKMSIATDTMKQRIEQFQELLKED
jgi:hypothetical protein